MKTRAWIGISGWRYAPWRPARRLQPRDVYVYFDNDVKVHAPYDALSLAAKVEGRRHAKNEGAELGPHARPVSRQARLRPHA